MTKKHTRKQIESSLETYTKLYGQSQEMLTNASKRANLMESKYNELAKTYNNLLTKWNGILLIMRD